MQYFLLRYLFDTSAQRVDKQALRYAIACTLATCLAGLIQYVFHLPFYAATFFILSSALSVYLSYGSNLLNQTLAIITGNVIITFCCLLAVLLSPYFWPSWLFLLVVSLVGYFYSTVNMGWFFIVKLCIALLSGIVVGLNQNTSILAVEIPIAVFSGGFIALFINGFITLFAIERSWKHHLNYWQYEFENLLTTLSDTNSNAVTDDLINQLNTSKPSLHDAPSDIGFLIERLTHSIVKFTHLIKSQPYINNTFGTVFNRLFIASLKSLKDNQPSHIIQAYHDFREHIFKLRHQGYFRHLPVSIRKHYIECFFILEIFESNLLTYIQKDLRNKSLLTNVKNTSVAAKSIFDNLKKQRVFDNNKNLSVNAKIAIRAAIAIPLAFLIAKMAHVEHASWLILSTNIVLLVRQGDTIKKAFDRVGGHFIGALLALLCSYFIWPYFMSPFFWMPFLILITAYFYLKNYFIYAITLMLIILYFYMRLSPVNIDFGPFIFIRFVDVAFGSLLAMTAGLLIFPNVGIQPFPNTFKHIMNQYTAFLLMLKPTTHHKEERHVLTMRKQISQQLEDNQQLYYSLSFQPNCYIYYQSFFKILIQLQIAIFEQLESLTRCLHQRHNAAIHNMALRNDINQFLDILAENLKYTTGLLNSKHKHLDIKSPEISTSNVLSLHLQLEAAIESAFVKNDKNQIDFDELVSYSGIIYTINRINQLLLEALK